MPESIIVALITGGLSLLGVYFANRKGQALMEYRIDELTNEVKRHNDFARRLPVVEEQIKNINDKLKELEDDRK